MIAKVCEPGSDLGRGMSYLLGPGKNNEHSEQRVIASTGAAVLDGPTPLWFPGDDAMIHAGAEWRFSASRALGRSMESAWAEQSESLLVAAGGRGMGQDVDSVSDRGRRPADIEREGELLVDEPWAGREKPAQKPHVFHAVLSLDAKEGQLSDEQWGRIAADYVEEMGLAGREGEPDVRWAAVRHGLSKNGNDHIHIMASKVNSAGAWWDDRYWKVRSRGAADGIEERYGLRPVKDSAEHKASPEPSRGDFRRADWWEHSKEPIDALTQLSNVVRSSAVKASTEAQFIKDVRRQGVRIRPRFEKGGRTAVTGYSATADKGSDAGWKGGKQLGVDLSLTNLRKTWEDTPENRAEALQLWTRSTTVTPRKETPLQLQRWNTTQQHLAAEAIALGKLGPSDGQWMGASRDVAAVWAQLALQSQGPEAAAYSAAAREMARASQDRRYQARAASSGMRDAARHLSLLAMAGSPSSARGTLAVVEQMMRITEAVRAAQEARGERLRAERVAMVQSGQLRQVQGRLRTKAEMLGVAGRAPTTTLGRPGQREQDRNDRGR